MIKQECEFAPKTTFGKAYTKITAMSQLTCTTGEAQKHMISLVAAANTLAKSYEITGSKSLDNQLSQVMESCERYLESAGTDSQVIYDTTISWANQVVIEVRNAFFDHINMLAIKDCRHISSQNTDSPTLKFVQDICQYFQDTFFVIPEILSLRMIQTAAYFLLSVFLPDTKQWNCGSLSVLTKRIQDEADNFSDTILSVRDLIPPVSEISKSSSPNLFDIVLSYIALHNTIVAVSSLDSVSLVERISPEALEVVDSTQSGVGMKGRYRELPSELVLDTRQYRNTLMYLLGSLCQEVLEGTAQEVELDSMLVTRPLLAFFLLDSTAFQNYKLFLRALEETDQTLLPIRRQFLARYNAILYQFVPEAMEAPKESEASEDTYDFSEFTEQFANDFLPDLWNITNESTAERILNLYTAAMAIQEKDTASSIVCLYKSAVLLVKDYLTRHGGLSDGANLPKLMKSINSENLSTVAPVIVDFKKAYTRSADLEQAILDPIKDPAPYFDIYRFLAFTIIKQSRENSQSNPEPPNSYTSHF